MDVIAVLAKGCGCTPINRLAITAATKRSKNPTVIRPGNPGYSDILEQYGRDTPYLIIDGEKEEL